METTNAYTSRRKIQAHTCYMQTLLLVSILSITNVVVAQQLGVDVCACSPSFFQFTFDLRKNCSANVLVGPGIEKTECSIAPFQATNTTNSTLDLVPTSVTSIDIQELDSNLLPIVQSSKFGVFVTGDSFNYTSVVSQASVPGQFTVSQVPKAIQLAMLGYNTDGVAVFFQALVIYVVNCSVYPVIESGSTIGWISLVETAPAPASVCPRAAENVSSTAPTISRLPVAPTNVITTVPGTVPLLSVPTTSPVSTPIAIATPTVMTSQPQQVVPGSTRAPFPFRSSKHPISFGSTKSPSLPTSADKTVSPSIVPSDPCSTSKGKGKGKGKSKRKSSKKSGKGKGVWSDGKGKGGVNLDSSWSIELFEKYGIKHECKSKKDKSHKDKGKSKKSKKGGKGKGDGYRDDDYYYYDGDDEVPMAPSALPNDTPSKPIPTTAPTTKKASPTASSLKGHPPSFMPVPVGPSIVPDNNMNKIYDNQVVSAQASSGSYEESINRRSFNKTANAFTILGATGGGVLCMIGLALLAKRQYKRHRKVRIEKALNIMKGLEYPASKGSIFRKI